MPIRVRSKANSKTSSSRDTSPVPVLFDSEVKLPQIDHDDDFRHVVKKLSLYGITYPKITLVSANQPGTFAM